MGREIYDIINDMAEVLNASQMVNQNNMKLSIENIFHRLTCNAKDVTMKERWRCILWEKQQH